MQPLKVQEVIENADSLIGEVLQVEGWIIQDHKSHFYVASNRSLSDIHPNSAILLSDRPLSEGKKIYQKLTSFENFIRKFPPANYPEFSQAQAEYHYREFKRTRDVKHLDVFSEMAMEDDIAALFPYFYAHIPYDDLYFSLFAEWGAVGPSSEDTNRISEGYAIGKLQRGAYSLVLEEIQRVVLNPAEFQNFPLRKNYRAYIQAEDNSFHSINPQVDRNALSVYKVWKNIQEFAGKPVKIKGFLVDYFNCFIIPSAAYLRLEHPEIRSLRVEEGQFLNSFIANTSEIIWGVSLNLSTIDIPDAIKPPEFIKPSRFTPIYVEGTAMIDENGIPFLSEIKVAMTIYVDSVHEWIL